MLRLPSAHSATFVVALAAACCAVSCRTSQRATAPAPSLSRHAGLDELRQAALGAGGNEVWVKGTATGEFPPPEGKPVEVLAAPRAFAGVVAGLMREAARRSLAVHTVQLTAPSGERTASVQISAGKRWAMEWRVRQVPRLLRAAIVIDDLGQNAEAARELLALPYPLTFSVLPRLRYTAETADEAFRKGHDVMLHLPMEPVERPGIGAAPDEVRVGMTAGQVRRLVLDDLDAVPHVRGVNNHMGSRATADPRLMAEVMEVLAKQPLYFVDSRTTGASVAWKAARQAGVPAFYRSVFLDDTESLSYTLGQLREFQRVIEHQGVALAIGHPHPTTIHALAEFLPDFARADIELLPVSRLVRLPEVARLTPPPPVQREIRASQPLSQASTQSRQRPSVKVKETEKSALLGRGSRASAE